MISGHRRIEYYFPKNTETLKNLKRDNPSWNTKKIFKATGINKRFIAKNEDIIETIQVINIGVNGEWNFQRPITPDDELGVRTLIIRIDFNETS